ncbi:MAG: zinc ribbon domain-containing protein [Deltaproteobacteria bacterium]|jgi:putative FmdB family regulatory protein
MPLYEFRCLKCNDCFEILVMKKEEAVSIKCPHCKSDEFERILSASCYSMGSGSGKSEGISAQTHNCPSGSCTTYEIPGHEG